MQQYSQGNLPQYQPVNRQVQNPNIPSNVQSFSQIKSNQTAKPLIKKSIFNIGNFLILLLTIYAIFSFSWLVVLYAGIDGNKACLEDNFLCNISAPYTKQAIVAVNNNNETKKELVKQKAAKNYVRDIVQNQIILSDEIVKRQQGLEKSISNYKEYIQNNIRFINGKPEFTKTFSQDELENKKTEVNDQQINLKKSQDAIYQNKSNIQKQIIKLYQDLGERDEKSFIAER